MYVQLQPENHAVGGAEKEERGKEGKLVVINKS